MSEPKFEKRNHHYVPQYWQRGFKGDSGHIFGLRNGKISQISSRSIMSEDWLYTVFDEHWRPSDALEDALSVIESRDAALFRKIVLAPYIVTAEDCVDMANLIAMQTCRHPDIFKRYRRLQHEFADLLASVHTLGRHAFEQKIVDCGIGSGEASDIYVLLITRTPEQLALEVEELKGLAPQSPMLPAQDALRSWEPVSEIIKKTLNLELLYAPPADSFVLGDTPMPQQDMAKGFSVPMSRSVALVGKSSTGCSAQTTIARRLATPAEVQEINRYQAENALEVVIGPSESVLKTL